MFCSNCSKDLWTFTSFHCRLTSNSLSHLHRFHEKWRFLTLNIWVITSKNEGNVGSQGSPVFLSQKYGTARFPPVSSVLEVRLPFWMIGIWDRNRTDLDFFFCLANGMSIPVYLNIVYYILWCKYCMYSCCFFMSNLASILIQKKFAFWIDSLRFNLSSPVKFFTSGGFQCKVGTSWYGRIFPHDPLHLQD